MNPPSWPITTLIGVIAGYLFPRIINVFVYAFRRLKRERVEGSWMVYHTTNRDGKPQIEKSTFEIKKGIMSEFSVKENRKGIGIISKGTLRFERNYWLIHLKAETHDEEISMRLINPIPTADDFTWGMYLSLDFQGNPIAGAIILSRKELSDDEVLKLLSSKIKTNKEMKLITV